MYLNNILLPDPLLGQSPKNILLDHSLKNESGQDFFRDLFQYILFPEHDFLLIQSDPGGQLLHKLTQALDQLISSMVYSVQANRSKLPVLLQLHVKISTKKHPFKNSIRIFSL